ncbi:SgcJ/EcaC family oxidoreductase [Streptomyces sp. NPDC018045]|uniref:SgcJ/EcaC family oxidoreductase n=1 Tax=Streptomyces sp. NPDC018045 TaxID=3365037 RepID=UPI00379EF810
MAADSTEQNAGNVLADVRAVPGRIVAAWQQNDGEAFADAFTEDATLVLPGTFLTGRRAIGSFMTGAFAGPFKGTRVTGDPVDVRVLSGDVAVLTTRGGVIPPGATALPEENAIHATWVLVRHAGDWLIAAYQNTPAVTARS